MIIPVRCFTCGKVRMPIESTTIGCVTPSGSIDQSVGRSMGGWWGGFGGHATCLTMIHTRVSPLDRSIGIDDRASPTEQQPQVIGNKYEVYVQYLKNDYKEGYARPNVG